MTPPTTVAAPPPFILPEWAGNISSLYNSGAAQQFLLHGNVSDRFLVPAEGGGTKLSDLREFLLSALLPGFDVVLSYDVGNGIRVEKGGDVWKEWPALRDNPVLPKNPRPAIETMTHFFRYAANLARLGGKKARVACLVFAAQLAAPAAVGTVNDDLSARAVLLRDWADDSTLRDSSVCSFLVCDNLADVHPIVASNPRALQIKVPLPSPDELKRALETLQFSHPVALRNYLDRLPTLAGSLAGATFSSLESLLQERDGTRSPLVPDDLARLKKMLVERDSQGLIEFIEPRRSLKDLYGQEKVKEWLRGDIKLWERGEVNALPMGYLLCGPVGTGKTFMVECLAGEAGVPVVKLKNFRDKWVGSTEGNLEKIFRLLEALGRCYVFVDEADQALGRRDADAGDGGLSGRVYGMIAQTMSDPSHRGQMIWVLASSRPDLIEVDLKRPGRIDVKIPLFPTLTEAESYGLVRALCQRRGLALPEQMPEDMRATMPRLLTPGAAEALAVKAYRSQQINSLAPEAALRDALSDYQPPIAPAVLASQIQLAINEASDLDFVPTELRRPAGTLS